MSTTVAASSGECIVYCNILDIGSVSGDVQHFMRVSLYKTPMHTTAGKFFKNITVIKYFDSDNYANIIVRPGTHILVEVPTIGLKINFTVPDQDSYNIARVAFPDDTFNEEEGVFPIVFGDFTF